MNTTKKSRILVVDDTPKNIQLLGTILRREGYQLNMAQNGLQALAVVEDTIPDLILLDVMMPELDGFETCNMLKADDRTKNIPVIFLTAKVEIDDIAEGFKLGAVDYILKPFNQVELLARVKNHLELKHARERVEWQNQDLQANLKMREDLSNMIVHDIRTPLTVILGMTAISKIEVDNPDLHDYIMKIEKNVHRVNAFLNDMLMLAKMKGQTVLLDRINNDIFGLIQETYENFTELAEARGVKLEFNKATESFETLSLDTNLFSRVMDNLISNALKYAPRDSTVSIQVENLGDVDMGQQRHHKACIKIIDEGPGIPEEDRERIFNLFESGNKMDKSNMSFGLGLTFCKMVIEAHGGLIFASAKHPQGTIITIVI